MNKKKNHDKNNAAPPNNLLPRDVPLVTTDAPSPQEEEKEMCPEPLYACDICGQDGLTEGEMRTHVLVEHIEGQISCPFCDLEGTTLEEMNIHVNAAHLDYLSLGGSRTTSAVAVETSDGSSKCSSLASSSSTRSNPTSTSKYAAFEGSSSGEQSNYSSLKSDQTNSTASAWPLSDEDDGADDSESTLPGSEAGSPDEGETPMEVMHYSTASVASTPTKDQSLKRAKLRLDVPTTTPLCSHSGQQLGATHFTVHKSEAAISESKRTRTNTSPSSTTAPAGAFSCPMCPWTTNCPKEITRHVNVTHSDILSPAKPRDLTSSGSGSGSNPSLDSQNNNLSSSSPCSEPSTSTSMSEGEAHISNPLVCPICRWSTDSSSDLEAHVNAQHIDILSPSSSIGGEGEKGKGKRPGPGTPMSVGSSSGSGSPQQVCPVCGMDFSDTDSLTLHVDGHFSAEQTPVLETGTGDVLLAQEMEREEREAAQREEQKHFDKLQEMYGMKAGKNNSKKYQERGLERAVYTGQLTISDYYNKKVDTQQANLSGVDDGHSSTKGILPKLKQFYKGCGSVSQHWLASPLDHFAVSYGDKGWGCGYRNLQMLLSCLSNNSTYEQVLFNGRPLIPSIQKIQRLIEAAWAKGFDVQGCEQLGGKVVNTTKWIGATEIVATLSSLKVKCQLVDFHYPSGKDGTHPRLFEWVRDYFRKDAAFKPPLYLQHQGHSRTIVGIEELKDGALKLLIFDPSCSRRQMNGFVNGEISGNLMKSIRRTTLGLKARQYQIVAVVGVLAEKEYEV